MDTEFLVPGAKVLELLAGALEAADAAHVRNISPAEPLCKQVHEEVVELPGAVVLDARYGFKKVWPYAPTRAVRQLVLIVIGRPKMDFGRLCSIPSALWAEEWNSCAV